MRRALWCATVAAAVAVPAAGDGVATNTFDEVAETNQRPPSTPVEVTYSALQMPMTDGTGRFLFDSQFAGGNLAAGLHDSGVLVGKRGAVQLVARAGGVAPGTGGAQWSDLLGVGQILRPSGRIAFPGEIAGADSAHKGALWAGLPGSLQLLVREGDPAPGTTVSFASGTRYFQDGVHLSMNDAGQVALRAKLAGTGVTTSNDQALFAGTPGALALVARLGGPAPNAGGATFIKSFESFTAPSIDASGHVLFRGHLTGTGVTANNADAIWYGDPASPDIVVRGGQPAVGPGIPQSAYLIGLGSEPPVVNDAGRLLFESPYFDGANFVECVWLGTPDALAPIARHGENAPGDPQNATFAGLFLHLRLNGAGHAAFHATLSSGPSDWGLFAWDGAALHEIWRKGAQAPGMPAGETFDGVATEDVFLNAQGKVLFRATTAPSIIQGVWIADPATGDVQLVARNGVNATIGATTRLLIDLTLFSGPDTSGSPQDGRSSPFGDDGTYAILGQTIDGFLEILTNAGGAVSAGAATPTSLSVGTTVDVTGSGFGGGATKFKPPTAWLTVGSDPKKIRLRVDRKTASDSEIHATLASLRKGAHGAATLHVLPRVKGAAEATLAVTIELPSLADLSATDLHGGETLTLTGAYFGAKKRFVRFNATVDGKARTWKFRVKTWADGSITAVVPKRVVPKGAPLLTGAIVVTNDAGDSPAAIAFTIDA